MTDSSEQAVAAFFHLSRSLRKREKHDPAVDKIVEAIKARGKG